MLRKRSRPAAVNASSNATTTTSSIIISGGNSTTPTTVSVFPHPEKTSKPTLPSSLLFFNPSSSTIMSSLKDSNQSVVSPSSVLDSVSSSSSRLLDKRFFFSNPFITSFTENKQSTQPQQQHPHSWNKSGISVALIDSSSSFLKPNHTSNSTTPWASTNNSSKLVVFGSHQLRIQIPSSSQPTSQLLNPNSPVEFGIKTPRSNLTPNFDKRTTGMEKDSPNQMRKSFSMEEMELSEDYTCVISRGPNPKTTHIFGNRVVECSSCGGGSRSRVWEMKRDEFGLEQEGGSGCLDCVVSSSFSSEEEECCHEDLGGARSGGEGESFLSHCCLCKKTLGDENVDIYMYRGEKAFCSQECRDQGMLLFDGNQS